MSNSTTNTHLGLVVGSSGQAGAVAATPDLLLPGDVGAYKPDGTLADGTETLFFIARGGVTPGKYMRTDDVDMASKGAYAALKIGSAQVSQVDFIGYNGVSGDIDSISDNMYYVRLNMQELLGSASDARVVKHGVFHSGSTTSGALVSLGIAASINANFNADPEQKVHATVTTSAADDAVAITGTTLTYKSKVVTTGAAHGGVVGDRLRLATAGLLSETTFLISKVIDANTVEITNTWYSPTVTGNSFLIPQANLDGTESYGVKLIGQLLDWSRGKVFNGISMWNTSLEDWGTTPLDASTGAYKGNLTGKEVCDLETFAQGFYGEQYRVGEPALFDKDAYGDPNLLYDGHRYHTVNDEVVGIGATPTSKKEFLVVLPQSESGSAIATLLTALLT